MRRISADELRRDARDVLDLVEHRGTRVVITRYGRPVAILCPFQRGEAQRVAVRVRGEEYSAANVEELAAAISAHSRTATAKVTTDGTLQIVDTSPDGNEWGVRSYTPDELVVP